MRTENHLSQLTAASERNSMSAQILHIEFLGVPAQDVNSDRLRVGFRESRRCSRDTYPESYITEHTVVYEQKNISLS